MATAASRVSNKNGGENREKLAKQVAQQLRNDLHMISNEARKKHPAVREAAERGAMRLKNISEQKGFTLQVLSATDDIIHPLLFACDSKNPRLVQLALSALQKIIQYNAIPQRSVEGIVAALKGLVDSCVEELKVLQTIMLLASSTEHIRGKIVSQVLVTCFVLYSSKDPSIHNTANVAIRQVVQTMFDRLNALAEQGGLNSPEPPPPDSSPSVSVDHRQLPVQVRDAYLLFQDLCFLINGDPSAWLPASLPLDVSLGLELLEIVLRSYPVVFAKEKLFSVLLTERVCPLVIKLFSPSSKHRHSAHHHASSMGPEKPSFGIQIRLLRILGVLIKHYFAYLVMQCEIFLCMLVKFLDNDKPLWQRTLAVEVLHTFASTPALLRVFCECYDMQEHSTNVFTDVINGLGAFIQSNLSNMLTSSTAVSGSGSAGHMTGTNSTGSGRGQHLFVFRGVTIQADPLPSSTHSKPLLLEMLDKQEVPSIPEGYPLMVAMVSLLEIIKSISAIVTNQADTPPSVTPLYSSSTFTSHTVTAVSETMLSSCWTAVLAALAVLLDTAADDQSIKMVLEAHRLFIQLCGTMELTSPRDAFLTALCKSALPPKYAMSFVAQPGSRPVQQQSGAGDDKRGGERSAQARLAAHFDPGKKSVESSLTTTSSSSANTSSSKKRLSYLIEEGGSKVTSPVGGGPVAIATQPSGVLTPKNVECILTLLHLIHQHGRVLDSAWHLALTTIQHVAFIVGKAPSKAGTLTLNRPADSSALVLVSIEKRSEMSEVSEKLQDLFTNTRFLPESSVMSLVDALCQLSDEAMHNHQVKEISLFPVASLLETGMSNLSQERVGLVWDKITSHLTMVCNHSDSTVRLFAADALTHIIRYALVQEGDGADHAHQLRLLSPLLALTQTGHLDVRQKQMECVSNILHSSGQLLKPSWTTLLDVISAASHLHSDTLVRAGFQCLQLIVTDYLPLLPSKCLPFCMEVTGLYGVQNQDLNISLTSIGLLWNIADYLFQNQSTVQPALEALRDVDSTLTTSPTSPSHSSSFLHSLHLSSLPVFDAVWMLLFQRLADLCVNEHSAIRKSAAQTLFSTISAHGGLLQEGTWQAVIWKVLFSVLDRVSQSISSASASTLISSSSTASSSTTSNSSFLVHHTRNTASKQWAETQVIVLGGVARVFQSRLDSLSKLDGFERVWSTLLDNIKECACSPSNEVAIAAMTSFKQILEPPSETKSPRSSLVGPSLPRSRSPSPFPTLPSAKASSPFTGSPDREALWERAWLSWRQIGHEVVTCHIPSTDSFQSFLSSSPSHDAMDIFFDPLPTQSFLVQLLTVFTIILRKLRSFTAQYLHTASQILEAVVLVPVPKDVSPFLVPAAHEDSMTSAQSMVLSGLALLFTTENILDDAESAKSCRNLFARSVISRLDRSLELHQSLSPQIHTAIVNQLLSFSVLAWSSPSLLSLPAAANLSIAKLPVVVVNYTSFALSSLVLAVQLCCSCGSHDLHVTTNIVEKFVKTLQKPLSQRYGCPTAVWTCSLNALLSVLEVYLPALLEDRACSSSAEGVWPQLGQTLESFLFAEIPVDSSLTNEELRRSEQLDLKVVKLIRNHFLPNSSSLSSDFMQQITSILNRGSIHSAASDEMTDATASPLFMREEFARSCFESLLQLSFMSGAQTSPVPSSQLALHALLERSEEVLRRFIAEERLSGTCPPARALMNEVTLVLKSTSVLISSLKQAQHEKSLAVDAAIWSRIAQLYPALVDCVTCHNMDVRVALKETLSQFTDLIANNAHIISDTVSSQ